MNIGIFVHSLTGNTYSVVERLARNLAAQGHEVHIQRLTPIGGEKTNVSNPSQIELDAPVDTSSFDFVVFAGPVRGFSQSPVMAKCLSVADSLAHKRVACLVTQQLSKPWMGGNRAIKQMRQRCEDKGGIVVATGIVNWKNKQRERLIKDAIDSIERAIGSRQG